MDESIRNLKSCLTSFSSWADHLCSRNFSPTEKANIRTELTKLQQKELQAAVQCVNRLFQKFGG